ncbi:MAG: hypothetical protein HYV27_06270 [Candidatus Hydrogenedentes bacterium]|nr:hypothetical protein [Candidatus Hydrogenedentota bacterium]
MPIKMPESGEAENVHPENSFERMVLPDELQEINKRRLNKRLPPIEIIDECRASLSREDGNGLVGLCLSGGGVRSSTFCLGVVQVLARTKVLRLVDYLSTVSGGGYLGAYMSTQMSGGQEWNDFPLRRERKVDHANNPVVNHLRNGARYLVGDGKHLAYLRLPALALRGLFINLLAILPPIVLFVAILHIRYFKNGFDYPHYLNFNVTLVVFSLWLLWIFLFPAISTFYSIFRAAAKQNTQSGSHYWVRDGYGTSFGALLFLIAFSATIELMPYIVLQFRNLVDAFPTLRWQIASSVSLPAVLSFLMAQRGLLSNSTAVRWAVGILAAIVGPLVVALIFCVIALWCIEPENYAPGHYPETPYFVYTAALTLFVYGCLFININRNSLHQLYRDRLSEAFLQQHRGGDSPVHCDSIRLSTLNYRRPQAPFHLINTTINLFRAKPDDAQRGRRADRFTLSSLHAGSNRTGYCSIIDMEKAEPNLDLGTAMAISGAAVSPVRGTASSPLEAFTETMINARLDYWLPAPNALPLPPWLRVSVGPIYLFFQLFNFTTNFRLLHRVNLSDGGHLENLGLVELLRRRCRYIIAVDAECDPDHEFDGLTKALRYAMTDVGARIELDATPLRKLENGHCSGHALHARIIYAEADADRAIKEESGELIYIKASLTGDEAEYVRAYKKEHPAFPHETTADQFFDEEQFEAYRALGFHAALELFPNDNSDPCNIEDFAALAAWFKSVKKQLQPGPGKQTSPKFQPSLVPGNARWRSNQYPWVQIQKETKPT